MPPRTARLTRSTRCLCSPNNPWWVLEYVQALTSATPTHPCCLLPGPLVDAELVSFVGVNPRQLSSALRSIGLGLSRLINGLVLVLVTLSILRSLAATRAGLIALRPMCDVSRRRCWLVTLVTRVATLAMATGTARVVTTAVGMTSLSPLTVLLALAVGSLVGRRHSIGFDASVGEG